MSIKFIETDSIEGVTKYSCSIYDSYSTFAPLSGSIMKVLGGTNNEVVAILQYDGSDWNVVYQTYFYEEKCKVDSQFTTLEEADAAFTAIESARRVDAFTQGEHDGLDFAYGVGVARNDNVVTHVAAGTVTLTDDSTNYVEVAKDGTVSANTTAYTTAKIPLYKVVTASEVITTVQDDRCFIS